MRAGKKRIKRVVISALLAVSLLSWLAVKYQPPLTAQAAVFDESKAMPYSQYAAANEIENSTLFIGTYLIYSQAMTDELYELATTSAEDSGQGSVYYKSELSSGYWYDITDGQGLDQINGNSVRTEESELADLWVTHVVGSDGILREVVTGADVSPFDVPDPYDLYNLPELEPLRIQYDTLSEDSEGVDQYYYEHLSSFFQINLRNTVTEECDRQLAALKPAYDQYQEDGETELAKIISTLMDKIDSRRRAEVLYQLSQPDDCELNYLQEVFSGSEYREEDYDDEQFVESSSLLDALGSSIENCQSSYTEHTGNMLDEGTTVLKNVEYELSMDVIEGAEDGADLGTPLLRLQHLYHIEDDVIADAAAELELLNSPLIPRAEQKYQDALADGAGDNYRAAQANRLSQAARNALLEERRVELEAINSELQYLLTAKSKRMPAEEAIDDILSEMDKLEGYREDVAEDDFSSQANESIDGAQADLKDLAVSTASSSESYSSDIQALENRKDGLQDERQQAVDDNDLSGAKRLDAEIALVDQQIAEKEAELNAILNSDSSSASDKALATLQSGDSTLLGNINKLKDKALSSLADGSAAGGSGIFDNMVGALAALGAEDALNEVRDSLANSGAGDGAGSGSGSGSGNNALLKAVDQAIADSKDSSLHGANDGSDVSSYDETFLEGMIDQVFGGAFDALSDADQAAATAALDRLGEQGNATAAGMSREYLNLCLAANNGYIYQKLAEHTEEYIPLSTIGKAADYRYVYERAKKVATLTKSGKVFQFTLNSDQITLTDKKVKTLKARVEQQNLPYIGEMDAKTYFSCEAEYVEGTDYGICLTEKMQKKAEELAAAIQEGGQ